MEEEESVLDKAARRAYRLLMVRPRSEKELRTRLREKGFSAEIVDKVAARCLEQGYLNDAAAAMQWARSLAVDRLWGNRRIEMKLGEKGLAREIVQDALSRVREEIPEGDALVRFLEKKGKGRIALPENDKEKRRLVQSLVGRGFPPGLIFETLKLQGEEEFHDGE